MQHLTQSSEKVPLHNDTHGVTMEWSNKTDPPQFICPKIWLLSKQLINEEKKI